jgi:hypothetical protein
MRLRVKILFFLITSISIISGAAYAKDIPSGEIAPYIQSTLYGLSKSNLRCTDLVLPGNIAADDAYYLISKLKPEMTTGRIADDGSQPLISFNMVNFNLPTQDAYYIQVYTSADHKSVTQVTYDYWQVLPVNSGTIDKPDFNLMPVLRSKLLCK